MGYMEVDQNLKWHNLFHDNQEFSNLVLLKACVGAKCYWKTGRGISPSVLMVRSPLQICGGRVCHEPAPRWLIIVSQAD